PGIVTSGAEIIHDANGHRRAELRMPLKYEFVESLAHEAVLDKTIADRITNGLRSARLLKRAPERSFVVVDNRESAVARPAEAVGLFEKVAVRNCVVDHIGCDR